ncbi:arginase family protein [Nonomuraea soli]|uniref:Arginase n=1 Tax=Nonomuraea soli TaxID=1032476 RepID=A0A7W0CFT6_9ACTN|nr:arginase family protein [Nonomuraea soli]MBA2890207.1 arginase [Nonomuraea soli]
MTDRTVIDAPSNLGLRPPAPGTVPGCYKLAGALRDQGIVARLGAADGGCVTPPRYDRTGWQEGDGVFNAAAMAAYSVRLADRVGALLDDGRFPVVLGGDCSIDLGTALALARRGRHGMVYVDGHSDFRHPGNSSGVGAAGGEAAALVTGRGQDDLTDLEGRKPYILDSDMVIAGIRDYDDDLEELAELKIPAWTTTRLREAGGEAAGTILGHLGGTRGFWVHLDVDALDPEVMPAVDSPDPGGLTHGELRALLAPLLADPGCLGLTVAIFDPDLDQDGRHAAALTDTLVSCF